MRNTAGHRAAWGVMTAGALLLLTPTAKAQAVTYDVSVQAPPFTLYTDPYNGNQIKVGGFSGIYPAPCRHGTFYVVTDRGPAPDFLDSTNVLRKTWALPEFGPHIITVKLQGNGKAKIEDIKPLTGPHGQIITGLPTTIPATDVPYDFNLNQLSYDEDSIDAEGIAIGPLGHFWICEEYKPSIACVASNGRVLFRMIPAGTLTGTENVPTFDVLPAVLAKRRSNRGFEGVASSADGHVYAIVQRPLNNPNRAAADANGNARLVDVNLLALLGWSQEPPVRQYLYQMPPANGSVTVSDLFSTGPGKLLVPERFTDKLFEINLAGATDITSLEDPVTGKLISDPSKTIEQLNPAGLATQGIVPVSKTVVIHSLTAIDPLLAKVEGVCVVGDNIVLTYDNDFNVAEAASTPANPNPDGPFVQLELLGANFPRIFVVPMP
ncbi:MAG: Tat pathway signal protein [Verrucomicrobiales bacterium]|nr:Tat pathway signal protein [Verrucomicrobiales bacterium]